MHIICQAVTIAHVKITLILVQVRSLLATVTERVLGGECWCSFQQAAALLERRVCVI